MSIFSIVHFSIVLCCIWRSLPDLSSIQLNINKEIKSFLTVVGPFNLNPLLTLHTFTSQRAVLCVGADYKECRRILAGALSCVFGPTGFTGFSLSTTITAVWATATLPAHHWLRYSAHRCVAAFLFVAFFRLAFTTFSLFWCTLFWFPVRWFLVLLWRRTGLKGCDWRRCLDGGWVDLGAQASRVGLYRPVADDYVCEVIVISLLFGKVDKHLQKWRSFNVKRNHQSLFSFWDKDSHLSVTFFPITEVVCMLTMICVFGNRCVLLSVKSAGSFK